MQIYNLYIKHKTDYISLLTKFAEQSQIDLHGGSSKKWTTLEHNGVMFHPIYKPHNIPIKYDGETINLPPEAEEYITYYVHPRYDKYKSDKFSKNFFRVWKKILPQTLREKISDFKLVDTSLIANHVMNNIQKKKEQNKQKTSEQREQEKQQTEKYKFATVNGTKQALDNFIVEPPTIFVGRGNHPLLGSIKFRIRPEDVTVNIGKNVPVPVPVIEGDDNKHSWKEVIHDSSLEWIASWQNNVTLKINYARFGRKSIFKMKSDEKKYDLARKLKKKICSIRQKNNENLKSTNLEIAQLATALYLIDTLALRVGNEKTTDQADTVGVSTLKLKNITLAENNEIKLDFLGKDSVRYVNKIRVPDLIYENLKKFTEAEGKSKHSDVFDLIDSDRLNRYLKDFMQGLTSKVFRTFNASSTMQIELKKIIAQLEKYSGKDLLQKAKHLYDLANLKVAKLCNHQKILSQNASASMAKTEQKIKDLKKKMAELKQTNRRVDSVRKKMALLKNKKKLQAASKTLSAGTSKINYIDPRITVAFLKKLGLFDNIATFFNESQRRQFEWATTSESDFVF